MVRGKAESVLPLGSAPLQRRQLASCWEEQAGWGRALAHSPGRGGRGTLLGAGGGHLAGREVD